MCRLIDLLSCWLLEWKAAMTALKGLSIRTFSIEDWSQILKNVVNVNAFSYTLRLYVYILTANTIYI